MREAVTAQFAPVISAFPDWHGEMRHTGADDENIANFLCALERLGRRDPTLLIMLEPMLGVTLTPTMAHASDKINVIPSRAQLRIDCRVPPGLCEEAVARRIAQVLGEPTDDLRVDYTEQVVGNSSPVQSELMSAIDGWVSAHDPGASAVPVILPVFSDSLWFREAFPECVHRLGPMVLGVCRRILGNPVEAEDAFQATFLTVFRKWHSVRDRRAPGVGCGG